MSDPYGGLEPDHGPGIARAAEPGGPPEVGGGLALLRGVRKRCPRCGDRRIFVGWFALKTLCPRCALRFEEEQGGYLGAMAINYSLSFAVWIAALTVTLGVTLPDVPIAGLLIMSAFVLIGVPLWFYPRSKTVWAAIEWLAHRTDPDYRAPAPRDARAKDLE